MKKRLFFLVMMLIAVSVSAQTTFCNSLKILDEQELVAMKESEERSKRRKVIIAEAKKNAAQQKADIDKNVEIQVMAIRVEAERRKKLIDDEVCE